MTENALSILIVIFSVPYNSNKPRSQRESCLFFITELFYVQNISIYKFPEAIAHFLFIKKKWKSTSA